MEIHKRTIKLPAENEVAARQMAVITAVEGLLAGVTVIPEVRQEGDSWVLLLTTELLDTEVAMFDALFGDIAVDLIPEGATLR